MHKRQITLSDTVTKVVESQVAVGRYKDFSSAIQGAAWHFFVGAPPPFDEFDVTPEETERSAKKDLERLRRARKYGILKPWKP